MRIYSSDISTITDDIKQAIDKFNSHIDKFNFDNETDISDNEININELNGKIFKIIIVEKNNTKIFFIDESDILYVFAHQQDCCEYVYIDDICGDLNDLIDTPMIIVEKRTNSDLSGKDDDESYTWTFYEFRTIKGSVTIRWYGSSNGWYSEAVELYKQI